MSKNVAFDFDGVFHKHVRPPVTEAYINERASQGKTAKPLGARIINIESDEKPTIWSQKIFGIIREYRANGYNVYIVTARRKGSQQKIREWLDEQGIDETIIPTENIKDGCSKKAQTIIGLQPEAFYDDSPHHIIEIQHIRPQLPENFRLYYVIPEIDEIIEVPSDLQINDLTDVYRLKFDMLGQRNIGGRKSRRRKTKRRKTKRRRHF